MIQQVRTKITSSLQDLLAWIKAHKLESLMIVLIFGLAAFVRLYNIRNTIIFLGDEGRDALVVKRILVDHKLTLLGPTASVGGFYLGPIYYYMMVPFMAISGLDPVSAAVMVALMGTLTVLVLYLLIRHWFGTFAASLVSLLYATSPNVISFSRSSWNPNPMPLFTLLALGSIHFGAVKKKYWLLFLGMVFFGIIIQLHYLGLIIGPVLGLLTLIHLEKKHWLKAIGVEILGFLVGASLYFGFELRHGFPNIRSVLEFVSRGGATTGPRSVNFLWLFTEMNRFNIESVLGQWSGELSRILVLLLFVAVIITLWFFRPKNLNARKGLLTIIVYWIVVGIGLGMYKGQMYYHYFQIYFLAPYLLLGFILSAIKEKRLQIGLGVSAVVASGLLLQKAPTWQTGSRLLDQTEAISNAAIELSEGKPFNFALIADGNSDHAYRFFLEVNDATPTPLETRVENQLIVVCEKPVEECQPLGHPIWEIAGFGRAEIETSTIVEPGISVFRLIHHPESQDLVGQPAPKG